VHYRCLQYRRKTPYRPRTQTTVAVLITDIPSGDMRPTRPLAIPRDVEDFLAHWRGIQKTGSVPTLRDFLDAPPFRLQSEVAIVDVTARGEMRFRLFGTGLSTIAGHDLTGTDVLSNFHADARAEATRIAWGAVSVPCGYYLLREMRRGPFETAAVGIGLPLVHQKTGKLAIVGFSSATGKSTDVVGGDESPFVRATELIKWIDIGAGTPNG